jgi:hypothetical protein
MQGFLLPSGFASRFLRWGAQARSPARGTREAVLGWDLLARFVFLHACGIYFAGAARYCPRLLKSAARQVLAVESLRQAAAVAVQAVLAAASFAAQAVGWQGVGAGRLAQPARLKPFLQANPVVVWARDRLWKLA